MNLPQSTLASVTFHYYQLLLLPLLLLFFPHSHLLALLTSLRILLVPRLRGVGCTLREVRPTTVNANLPCLHLGIAGWSVFLKCLIPSQGMFIMGRPLHPLTNWKITQSPPSFPLPLRQMGDINSMDLQNIPFGGCFTYSFARNVHQARMRPTSPTIMLASLTQWTFFSDM